MRRLSSILVAASAALAAALPAAAAAAPAPDPRIVNGGEAGHLAPFTVALFTPGTDPAAETFCGGSLLAPDGGAPSTGYVLTAAHCVEGLAPAELHVATGDAQTGSLRPGDARVFPVRQIAVHPHWDPETFRHDVAVLALAANPAREGVQLVAPEGAPTASDPVWWRDLAVTGWGISRADKVQDPVLQRALVDRWSQQACDAAYTTPAGERLFSPGEMLCGIGSDDGGDACLGDSGGPLVAGQTWNARVSDQRVLGVVSWGAGCGDLDLPTVYSRLDAPGLQWFVRRFTDGNPLDDAPFWQPYAEWPPTLSRTDDLLTCAPDTWANAGSGASYRYAIVPRDEVEDADLGALPSRAVTAADAGRELVCVVEASRDGAGGYGVALSNTVLIPAPPAPPAPPGDGGGGGTSGGDGPPAAGPPAGGATAPVTGGSSSGGGVRGGDVNRDAPRSPLTLTATKDCEGARCRIELRAKPAKGKRVAAVRAKVATCANARCTKRRTRTYTLTRGKDGTYRLRVTLKAGRHLLDVSSRGTDGRWQQPVRRTLTLTSR